MVLAPRRHIRGPSLPQSKASVRPKSWNEDWRREPIDGAGRPAGPAVRKARAQEDLPRPHTCARPNAREFRLFRGQAKTPGRAAGEGAGIPCLVGSLLYRETRAPHAALLPYWKRPPLERSNLNPKHAAPED